MSGMLDAILAICFGYPLALSLHERAEQDRTMEKIRGEQDDEREDECQVGLPHRRDTAQRRKNEEKECGRSKDDADLQFHAPIISWKF